MIDIQFDNNCELPHNYNTYEFKNKHKCAIFKIMMNEHIKYDKSIGSGFSFGNDGFTKSIRHKNDFDKYIIMWFHKHYIFDGSKNTIKVKDIF